MTPRCDTRKRSRGSDERGFTVIEVMVAALIVAITALAIVAAMNAATRNTFRAQQSQVLNDRLQSEIGKIKQLQYAQIALTTLPPHSTDPANPNYRVAGTSFNITHDPTSPAVNEPLAYNGGTSHDQGVSTVSGGTIDPGPTPFQTGDAKGNVYRYVTWQQDTSCTNCGSPWIKHVTVVATLDSTSAAATRTYQEVQSDIANPTANSNFGGPSGGGTTATPWTFWLTDTPCNNNSRQPITQDHKGHNTRGLCSNGLKTIDNSTCGLLPPFNKPCPGAPDLMYTEAPPCAGTPPDCTTPQPLYDYATEVDPTIDPNNDKGLQFRAGPSCNSLQSTWDTSLSVLNDTFDPNYFQKVHKWVSLPIPAGYGPIVFNGQGELDLWTKTVNAAVQPGKICAYIFYRHQVLGLTVDTPVINLDLSNLTYFTYSQNPWPTTWQELHIPLHFNLSVGNALTLVQNQQLGLAISVDGAGTGSGALEALYDAPSFDSRLQLQVNPGITLPF